MNIDLFSMAAASSANRYERFEFSFSFSFLWEEFIDILKIGRQAMVE